MATSPSIRPVSAPGAGVPAGGAAALPPGTYRFLVLVLKPGENVESSDAVYVLYRVEVEDGKVARYVKVADGDAFEIEERYKMESEEHLFPTREAW